MSDQHAWPTPGSKVSLRLPNGEQRRLILRERFMRNGTLIGKASTEHKPTHLYVRKIDAFIRGW